MAVRYSRAAHTVRAKEITLPENFDTLDPDFDGWEKILTSANSLRMAAKNIVTPEGPETATPLFSPEQQAWIESLIQDRTSRTPGEQGTRAAQLLVLRLQLPRMHRPPRAMWVSSRVSSMKVMILSGNQCIISTVFTAEPLPALWYLVTLGWCYQASCMARTVHA